jgi:hypothetical protein
MINLGDLQDGIKELERKAGESGEAPMQLRPSPLRRTRTFAGSDLTPL